MTRVQRVFDSLTDYGPQTSQTLAARLNLRATKVGVALNAMRRKGIITRTHAKPRVWRLVEDAERPSYAHPGHEEPPLPPEPQQIVCVPPVRPRRFAVYDGKPVEVVWP